MRTLLEALLIFIVVTAIFWLIDIYYFPYPPSQDELKRQLLISKIHCTKGVAKACDFLYQNEMNLKIVE